jgi:phosphoserine phosphatase
MAEALASWKEGATKQAILDFVRRVTLGGSRDFVAPADRVAVFDNDGTLWCEKPIPIQADFLFRRVARMVEDDPSLKSRQPWKAVAANDHQWLSNVITKHYHGDDSDLTVMAAGLLQTYAGSTVEEFQLAAERFVTTAQHPLLERPYLACAYQPMLELIRFLGASGFAVYLATGGGRDFLRPFTEGLYGIPRERVIGSSVGLKYRDGHDVASLVHASEIDIFDDGPTKPVRIWSRIGRRPILAAGNSNGDIPMLHFCAHPSRPSLALLLDHDDETREYAYRAGAEDALQRAAREHWTVVSMSREWTTVFAEPRPT